MAELEIFALEYVAFPQRHEVGERGVTRIRQATNVDELIAGSFGYLTTYVIERDAYFWKVIPGWAVAIEYKTDVV